jgi:ABC-type uncharacterized transport system ATPase subunit
VTYKDRNIAEVLGMTVDAAWEFFRDEPAVRRSLEVLREVGVGYLRLGQPATELSGGEAQRIKLATELQRVGRGNSLYVLDEPTTGLHPSDVDKLMLQLERLVDAGNTVIVVEHDMRVVAAATGSSTWDPARAMKEAVSWSSASPNWSRKASTAAPPNSFVLPAVTTACRIDVERSPSGR